MPISPVTSTLPNLLGAMLQSISLSFSASPLREASSVFFHSCSTPLLKWRRVVPVSMSCASESCPPNPLLEAFLCQPQYHLHVSEYLQTHQKQSEVHYEEMCQQRLYQHEFFHGALKTPLSPRFDVDFLQRIAVSNHRFVILSSEKGERALDPEYSFTIFYSLILPTVLPPSDPNVTSLQTNLVGK